MTSNQRGQRFSRWVFMVASIFAATCVDRKANRAEPTAGSSAPTPSSRSSDATTGGESGAPRERWGSALLRFDSESVLCGALRAATERQLALVRDPFESSSPGESPARLEAFRGTIIEHSACAETPDGAWATFFEGDTDPREWAWFIGFLRTGVLPAKHAGNLPDQIDSRASGASYTGKVDLFDSGGYQGPYRVQVVSDYDGDGSPEAVVWTAQLGQEVRSSARGMVWSFTKGAVTPYAKASQLGVAPFEVDANDPSEPSPLTDVDGDGRIDLLGYGPFAGVFKQGCGVIESFDALGPRLVLHSLPNGSFDDQDSVARARAKQQCAARPAHVLTPGATGLDQRASFVGLGCARLWSVAPSAIEAELNGVCGKSRTPDPSCDAPRTCSPELLAVFSAWTKKKPPFRLE